MPKICYIQLYKVHTTLEVHKIKRSTGLQPYKIKSGLYPVLATQVELSINLAAGKSTSQPPQVKLKKQYNTYSTD